MENWRGINFFTWTHAPSAGSPQNDCSALGAGSALGLSLSVIPANSKPFLCASAAAPISASRIYCVTLDSFRENETILTSEYFFGHEALQLHCFSTIR